MILFFGLGAVIGFLIYVLVSNIRDICDDDDLYYFRAAAKEQEQRKKNRQAREADPANYLLRSLTGKEDSCTKKHLDD